MNIKSNYVVRHTEMFLKMLLPSHLPKFYLLATQQYDVSKFTQDFLPIINNSKLEARLYKQGFIYSVSITVVIYSISLITSCYTLSMYKAVVCFMILYGLWLILYSIRFELIKQTLLLKAFIKLQGIEKEAIKQAHIEVIEQSLENYNKQIGKKNHVQELLEFGIEFGKLPQALLESDYREPLKKFWKLIIQVKFNDTIIPKVNQLLAQWGDKEATLHSVNAFIDYEIVKRKIV